MVADAKNNRVLIWNSFPSSNFAAADVVLGQPNFASGQLPYSPTAETLYFPYAVWSNGLQLFVADTEYSRILMWNTFPTENSQPADIVLGQPDIGVADDVCDPTARTFSNRWGLWFIGISWLSWIAGSTAR